MITLFRWLFVVPSAIVVSALVYVFVFLANASLEFLMDIRGNFLDWIALLLASAGAGYGFLWAGVGVAPKYKRFTALGLVVLFAVLFGIGVKMALKIALEMKLIWINTGWFTAGLSWLVGMLVACVAGLMTTEENGVEMDMDIGDLTW